MMQKQIMLRNGKLCRIFGVWLIIILKVIDGQHHNETPPKPNIVLIVTDDQDITMGGMIPMKQTQKLLSNEGITFTNAFTSSPICCPSRASILSGLYAHNHGTFNNSESGGCYGNHWRTHIESITLPVWLQQNGYRTFFAGKYLNEYNSGKVPPGWNNWYGLVKNSKYYNYTLIENGIPHEYTDEYFTDVVKSLALNFISNQNGAHPFFAMITPTAPHAPFTPADRHKDAFENIKVPQKPNYNVPAGEFDKHWLLRMPPATLPIETLNHLDDIYRKRWQTLMAVDEMIAELIEKLDKQNLLNNTFVIYTSDNGYHLGQFAMAFDKRQPYESDIRVPFLIRGPGVSTKMVSEQPIALIDILPTVLDVVGIEKPDYLDGISFAKYLDNSSTNDVSNYQARQILIEYWGEGNANTYNSECPWLLKDNLSMCLLESNCHCQDSWNNTYTCNRFIGNDENEIYCEFSDHENFLEAYDLNVDPHQLNNLGFTMLPSDRAMHSLALAKLQRCSGIACHKLH